MTNKLYISWQEFHQDAKNLAQLIKNNGEYNQIVAVSRGGLIPAGILAYELDIRNCQSINMSSYDGNDKRDDSAIELQADITGVDANTLIIDDLSDSGRTYRILREKFPSAKFITVYSKPEGASEVDICAKLLPDEWIVFPWDL